MIENLMPEVLDSVTEHLQQGHTCAESCTYVATYFLVHVTRGLSL